MEKNRRKKGSLAADIFLQKNECFIHRQHGCSVIIFILFSEIIDFEKSSHKHIRTMVQVHF